MNQPGNTSREKEFAGRRVLVTGGTRGMGRAVADLLAGAHDEGGVGNKHPIANFDGE